MMKRLLLWVTLLLFSTLNHAQTPDKPLILPLQAVPSASTWLLGQAYGNTTGAFNFGQEWYSAGQGLHFGIDFSAPCGTPLVAVADGVVAFVDDLGFGSAPHNLILRHEALGLTTLYGHLQARSALTQGEAVTQGQVVGYSGDPDLTCESRPHLHFEVRSLDYFTAYNPVDSIDANWHSLALIGSFGERFFQMDLENARRWLSLDEQATVVFGGRQLNNYRASLPLPQAQQAPTNPPLARVHQALDDSPQLALSPFDTTNCCWDFWWHPLDAARLFTIDGLANSPAQVSLWDVNTLSPTLLGTAPAPQYSPDYSHQVSLIGGGFAEIRNIFTGESWQVQTGGVMPALNTDNTRLLWIERGGTAVPGQDAPQNTVYLSDARATTVQTLISENGISAQWLDATRLIFFRNQRPYTQVDVYDVVQQRGYTLGRWYRPRGFSIAPSGSRLLFYLAGLPVPSDNGIYWLDIAEGASPQRLDWFGAYRWRDSESLYYIPFEPSQAVQSLWYYEVSTGRNLPLLERGLTIMNGSWSVNADGSQIIFRSAQDRNLWLLTIAP